MKITLFVSLSVTLGAAAEIRPHLPPEVAAGYTLAWANEFEGDLLNTSEWQLRTGARFASENRKANGSVEHGWLRLAVRKEKVSQLDYTAGGVISKREFKYGYYESRFRVPCGAGWHTSFWLMKNAPGQSCHRQEIDVIEQDSKDLTSYGMNLHTHKPTHVGQAGRRLITLGTNDSRDLNADCVPKAVGNVRKIIERARATYGASLPVLLVGPPNINKSALVATKPIANEREAQLQALGDAFESLARETQCEFASLFGSVPEETMAKDGVHLDGAGHAAMAKVLVWKLLP